MLLFLGCDPYSGIWSFWDLSCKPGQFLWYLHLSNPWIPIFALWKPWLLKHLLSSLSSQFLLSAKFFLKFHFVYEWLAEKSKMPWKEIILPLDPPSLWFSFSRICFSNPKCLTGHKHQTFISSVQSEENLLLFAETVFFLHPSLSHMPSYQHIPALMIAITQEKTPKVSVKLISLFLPSWNCIPWSLFCVNCFLVP